jgi:tetratricopeptide (TPR) repeat protein
MLLRRSTLALGLLLAFGPQAGFAQNAAQKVLLEQALYWKSKGNGERAAEAWKKLLIIDSNDIRATYELALADIRAARLDPARTNFEKIKKIDPKSPYLFLLEQEFLVNTPKNEKLLYEARLLQETGKVDQAIDVYKKVFDGRQPVGELALEYYTFLGYSTNGQEAARKGLEKLLIDAPDKDAIELALAKLLSRSGETRVESIRRLEQLKGATGLRNEVKESWRLALLWLEQPRGVDVPLFDAYLKENSTDDEIRKMRDDASKRIEIAPTGLASSIVTEGFTALERGDRAVAEVAFSKRLKESPNDPDALGGLGIVRLQQNKLDEARQLLSRAVAQPGGKTWNVALGNVRYLQLIEQASAAQRDGDTTLARTLFQQASRLDPKQSGAQLALAGLQVEAGEYEAAEKTYRGVLSQNKKDELALGGLISVLALNNKLAAAQQLLQSVTPEQVGGVAQMNRLKAA